ncbi:MAG: hypothetical protein NC541_06195 [bacterium]|nr:hypothetical protein [bacterium]
MHSFFRRFYIFCHCCAAVLCLALSAFLFAGGFLTTAYSTDMASQTVLFRLDNPLWNLLGLILPGILFLWIFHRKELHPRRLFIIVALWYAAVGFILILFGKTVPAADSMSVYLTAEELAGGNTAVISPNASYLSYYPQQVGLTAFYELLVRLWKVLPTDFVAFHFIKIVNVLLSCFILFFQLKTVKLLWKDEQTDCCYLVLAAMHLPFIMYTSFVYGEVPSFTCISAGLYFLFRFLQSPGSRRNLPFGLCSIAALSLGVALRKNNLIFVIAVLIVVFLQYLRDLKLRLLLFCLLCAFCSFLILPGIQKYYELRACSKLDPGVPAISYLAMGMQDVPGTRCGGWYNGFNFNTYAETGMDQEATAFASRQAIRERLETFRENPGYAVSFYLKKHLSQWADGTYASRQATLATYEGEKPRARFFVELYEGTYSRPFIEYSNLYQNILYLGFLSFCLFQYRHFRRDAGVAATQPQDPLSDLPVWTGLIGVLGGFLFHTFWEANSRYILLYGLMMLPFSARGIRVLLQWLAKRFPVAKK